MGLIDYQVIKEHPKQTNNDLFNAFRIASSLDYSKLKTFIQNLYVIN